MDETTQRTTAVDNASNRATANVSAVAAATEELATSIGEITRLVHRSTAGAQEAVDKANKSNVLIKGLAECRAGDQHGRESDYEYRVTNEPAGLERHD